MSTAKTYRTVSMDTGTLHRQSLHNDTGRVGRLHLKPKNKKHINRPKLTFEYLNTSFHEMHLELSSKIMAWSRGSISGKALV